MEDKKEKKMKTIKKGIEPTKENNTQTQEHNNKTDIICLVEFITMIVLIILGKYLDNSMMVIIGAVIGVAGLPFQLNGLSEEDDDLWEE